MSSELSNVYGKSNSKFFYLILLSPDCRNIAKFVFFTESLFCIKEVFTFRLPLTIQIACNFITKNNIAIIKLLKNMFGLPKFLKHYRLDYHVKHDN